jgi:hypothetical protein
MAIAVPLVGDPDETVECEEFEHAIREGSLHGLLIVRCRIAILPDITDSTAIGVDVQAYESNRVAFDSGQRLSSFRSIERCLNGFKLCAFPVLDLVRGETLNYFIDTASLNEHLLKSFPAVHTFVAAPGPSSVAIKSKTYYHQSQVPTLASIPTLK